MSEEGNARNPPQRLTVREALKQDIKDQADALFEWGIRRGLLGEEDRIHFYGDRHLKGGKEEYTPGIFPEEIEAKCRKIIDYDDIEAEVIRRTGNILDRALMVIDSRETRAKIKKVFDDIPRV